MMDNTLVISRTIDLEKIKKFGEDIKDEVDWRINSLKKLPDPPKITPGVSPLKKTEIIPLQHCY